MDEIRARHPAHQPHTWTVPWKDIWHGVGHHQACGPDCDTPGKHHPFFRVALSVGLSDLYSITDIELYITGDPSEVGGPTIRLVSDGDPAPTWIVEQLSYLTLAAMSRIVAWLPGDPALPSTYAFGIPEVDMPEIRRVNALITEGLLDGKII